MDFHIVAFGENHYNQAKQPTIRAMTIADNALNIAREDYSLLTDLYQLTMIACYAGEGIANKKASFELFTRKLPANFSYLIAMGLEQVIEYLQNFEFTAEQISALQDTGLFQGVTQDFWELLKEARFTGDLWAVPEGTAITVYEPILRIEAPLWQAQLVETYLLNTINYQTLIATKAARLRDIAGDQPLLLEFGTRRAFSPQASLWAARAALAGGMNATSNVLAALKLGQLPAGTLAHSLIMAFRGLGKSETEAFEAFTHYFPNNTLLIDTFDVIAAAKQIAQSSLQVSSVRIDSGDLSQLSHQVKAILPTVKIIVSGDIDEQILFQLKQDNCPIDGYGIGTKLVSGEPVNGVYKLVEIEGMPTAKWSKDKFNYPGRKQIFRSSQGDRLGLMEDECSNSEHPLLELVIKDGKRLSPKISLDQLRERTRNSVQQIPQPWQVQISDSLERLKEMVRAEQC